VNTNFTLSDDLDLISLILAVALLWNLWAPHGLREDTLAVLATWLIVKRLTRPSA
jgi:hypothetical protein